MVTPRCLTLFAALWAICPEIALADPPPPIFSVAFDNESAIWDPFADYAPCDDVEDVGRVCLQLGSVVCDGKGNCTGDTEFVFMGAVGKSRVEGSTIGPFDGSVKCNETSNVNKPVCNTKLRFETTDMLTATDTAFGVTRICQGEIDGKVDGPIDHGGFYSGKLNATVCVQCPGEERDCEKVKGSFELSVNPPIPWNATVYSQPQDKNDSKFEGVATDSLGFSYTAKGTYNEKRDESDFTLTGDKFNESNGASIKLRKIVTTESSVTSGTAQISVQGNQSTADLTPR